MFHWVQLLLTFTSLTRHDGHRWQRRNCIFFTFVFVFVFVFEFVIVLHYLERGSQLRVQCGRIWAKTAQSADKAETKEPRRVRTVNAHSRYFSFRRFLQNVVKTTLSLANSLRLLTLKEMRLFLAKMWQLKLELGIQVFFQMRMSEFGLCA